MNNEERLLEVPGELDENVGDLPRKKSKKKKSKEERERDRRSTLVTLIIILGITMFFWLWPKMKEANFNFPQMGKGWLEKKTDFNDNKNYIEYRL